MKTHLHRPRRLVALIGSLVLAGTALAAAAATTPRAPTTRPCGSTCSATSATRSSTTSSRRTTPGSRSSRPPRATWAPTTPSSPRRSRPGSGAGDVVAIEEGQVVNFLQSADKFVNFQDHGSNDQQDQWLPWKYAPGHHRRRQRHHRPRHRRRRPGDVLPHATCSRRPACRPTARRSARSGRPGRTSSPPASSSRTASADDKVHFIDSATNTYNSILMQTRRLHLLRHRRQPRHREQPGGQGGLGHRRSRWSTPGSAPSCSPSPTSGTPASRTAASPPSPARPG